MSTGQMLLVVGAITLLSFLALSINTMLVNQTQVMLDSQASSSAISLAQSLIDEIETKGFDQATLTTRQYVTDSLTAPSSLGPDAADPSHFSGADSGVYPRKSVAAYNDVDDYNGYIRIDTTSLMTNFRDSVAVYYVVEGSPDTKSASKTFMKRVDVTVSQQSMKKPLTVSDIIIYRKFF